MAYYINDGDGGARVSMPAKQVRLGPQCQRYAYRRAGGRQWHVYASTAKAGTDSLELRYIGTVCGMYPVDRWWYIFEPSALFRDATYDSREAAAYALLLAVQKSAEEEI